MDLEYFQEQVFFDTVRIRTSDDENEKQTIGTGFLMKVPLNGDEFAVVLVSNRHVLQDPDESMTFTLHQVDADNEEPDLEKTIEVNYDEYGGGYHSHPDSEVDLACVNISEALNQASAYTHWLPPELFADIAGNKHVLPGLDVWFVGYPDNRFDKEHTLPLLRRGYISSIPEIDFDGTRRFVIDAPVYPGSSGSPAFSQLDGEFRFIGVVTATMIRNNRLQHIPADYNLGVEEVIGLGLVIKPECVRELRDEARATILAKA